MTQQTINTFTQATGKKSALVVRVIGAVVLVLVLVAIGIFPRFARDREALAAVNEAAATHPVVGITHPAKGEPTSELFLPGNIQPLYTANLYARIDGYVERRNVDIGSKVRAGELLAVISAPEVDQQLLQARAAFAQAQASVLQAKAALGQAKANVELSRLTKERDVPLGEQHAISQQVVDAAVQTFDARVADVAAAEANVIAAEANVTANSANVSRLQQIQGFERIVAPFSGVITARNIERGDLVSTGKDAPKPLFSIAQSDTLRIQIDVPQSEAMNIANGQTVSLDVKERSGKKYTGTIIRNATSLDGAARTMLTEVQVDNRDGSLLAGMYAQVKFTLPQQRQSTIIPTSSLVIDHAGTHVVTVSADHTIHFLPVVIGKDLGTTIEVIGGLQGNEALVTTPNDLLTEGEHVEIRN